MFIDYAEIKVKAGKGGNGCVSFRREKYVPKGGPDGGDGGRGGHIIFISRSQLHTLQDFRYKKKYEARPGANGKGAKQTGKDGEDIIINVPCGTFIKGEDGNVIADLVNEGDEIIIAEGGKGGRGNTKFASATNRVPTKAEMGRPGEEISLSLELKLIADVGLVGKPNAGKSTLISRLSSAKPKIADYEFTTLSPALGIVSAGEFRSFVMADIPGLIEGAHKGKGLGITFLRHIERTKILLFLVDISEPDPALALKQLEKELKEHNPLLAKKKRLVVYNKIDLLKAPAKLKGKRAMVSALTGQGLDKLRHQIFSLLESEA